MHGYRRILPAIGLCLPFAAVAAGGMMHRGGVDPRVAALAAVSLAVAFVICLFSLIRSKPLPPRLAIIQLVAFAALAWSLGHEVPVLPVVFAAALAFQMGYTGVNAGSLGHAAAVAVVSVAAFLAVAQARHAPLEETAGAVLLYLTVIGLSVVGTAFVVITRERLRHELSVLEHNREAAAKLAEANVRLQDYAAQCVELALAQERVRLARDIHDTLGHMLSALIRQMDACQMLAPVDPRAAAESLGSLCEMARNGLNEVRQSVGSLRAPEMRSVVGRLHWFKLIEAFIETTGVEVRIEIEEDFTDLATDVDLVVYRVIQEGLTNAYRHGRATLMGVYVWRENRKLNILVSDNGHGVTTLKEGFGMLGMRERLRELDGRMEWRSEPGRGFDVGVEIPLKEVEA